MNGRRRIAVLGGCAAAVLLLAWYAGAQFAPATSSSQAGTVRLGPDPGEPVAAYLARLPATLPAPGAAVPALVQFAAEQPPATALAALGGATPRLAVFRIAVQRVQTALRFEPLETGVAAGVALQNARERARIAAAGDATRRTGRAGAVAAAEAARLADPGGATVLALVVEADRATLDALLDPGPGPSGVRAVEAAPAGTAVRELALSPLLPEQLDRADPPPDDGIVGGGGT